MAKSSKITAQRKLRSGRRVGAVLRILVVGVVVPSLSVLVQIPELGQAYNGDYWKIPIFYSGFVIAGYAWSYNGKLYTRYRKLYNQATTEGGGYNGYESVENLKHYRNSFRRYRDYSILSTVLIYVLQIIDANVFAMMHDFDVTDDLSVQVAPSVIEPITISNPNEYASVQAITPYNSNLGVQVRLTF